MTGTEMVRPPLPFCSPDPERLELGHQGAPYPRCAEDAYSVRLAREFWKNIYFCFIDYAKAFDCVDRDKL